MVWLKLSWSDEGSPERGLHTVNRISAGTFHPDEAGEARRCLSINRRLPARVSSRRQHHGHND